jgi:methyl-accepting chemotaxis protein
MREGSFRAAPCACTSALTNRDRPLKRRVRRKQMDTPTQTLLVIFIAVAAVSILMQAVFTVGMFIGARKAQKKMMGLADDVRLHALPAIIASRDVIQDITPKLKTITENLEAISTTVRAKTDKVGGLVENVTDRAQAQATRVDDMVKGTLDHLTTAVHALEHGIAMPVRQVNGIINGLRAGVDVMRKKDFHDHLEPEEDLFV